MTDVLDFFGCCLQQCYFILQQGFNHEPKWFVGDVAKEFGVVGCKNWCSSYIDGVLKVGQSRLYCCQSCYIVVLVDGLRIGGDGGGGGGNVILQRLIVDAVVVQGVHINMHCVEFTRDIWQGVRRKSPTVNKYHGTTT